MNIDFSYSGELAEIAIIGNFLDFIATFFLAFAIILLVVSIYQIIVMWRIFSKAGKPGWASLIPIYNTIVLFQICGLSPYLLLLIMIIRRLPYVEYPFKYPPYQPSFSVFRSSIYNECLLSRGVGAPGTEQR